MLTKPVLKLFSFLPNTENVLWGSAITLLLKVIGALLSFLVTLLLSKHLGVESLGGYFISFSIAMLCSSIARLGLDNAILKYAGSAYSNKDWGSINSLFIKSICWTSISCFFLSAVLYFGSEYFANDVFRLNELESIIKYLGLVIFPMALFNIFVSFFQAMRGITKSVLLNGVLVPLLMIIGILILVSMEALTTDNAVKLYGISCLVTLAFCFFIFYRLPVLGSKGSFPSKLLWLTSAPMATVIFAELLATNAPQLILAAYSTASKVGVFSVCTRIAILISFTTTAVTKVIAPRISTLHANGDKFQLRRMTLTAMLATLSVSSCLVTIIMIFPAFILGVFGESFVIGKSTLQVLAANHLLLVIFGVGRILLQMTGFEKTCRDISFLYVLLILVLSFIAIPQYDILGAAFSVGFASAVASVITLISVRHKLGFWLIDFSMLVSKKNGN